MAIQAMDRGARSRRWRRSANCRRPTARRRRPRRAAAGTRRASELAEPPRPLGRLEIIDRQKAAARDRDPAGQAGEAGPQGGRPAPAHSQQHVGQPRTARDRRLLTRRPFVRPTDVTDTPTASRYGIGPVQTGPSAREFPAIGPTVADVGVNPTPPRDPRIGGARSMARIGVNVDGVQREDEVEPRLLLVHWLRDKTRPGRHPDGVRHLQLRCLHRAARRSQREVLQRARRAGDGSTITTIQGLAERRAGTRCRPRSRNATACSAATAPREWCWPRSTCCRRTQTRPINEIREGLEGNLCRCTGYQNIVKSVALRRRPDEGVGRAGVASPQDSAEGGWHDDRHRRPPRRHHPVDRPVRPPQGRRPAAHRDDQLDRQHPAARHPAHADRPQPVRARQDHPDRLRAGAGHARRGRRVQRGRTRRRQRQGALRLAGRRRHRDARVPGPGRRRGPARRRLRRRRAGHRALPGRRRGRGDRGRLRAAARRRRHGGGAGRRCRRWCTNRPAPTTATPSTTSAGTTRRPSPTPMSWSSGGSSTSG